MKPPAKKVAAEAIVHEKSSQHPFTVVAIGASAGGLEAFSLLLKNLPADTGMAFIYVQHLSPDHKSLLTPILSKITKMKVEQIDNMEKMEPNTVYVIPPNKIIKVVNGHIQLLPRIKKNSPTLSIDILFSTLAETHHEDVIGIVLSGYANDGMIGLKAIKDAGGVTFAQDETAKATSMPNSAISTGSVDFILSPDLIAKEIVKISKIGMPSIKKNENESTENESTENESTENESTDNKSTENESDENEVEDINQKGDLDLIFELLVKETGVDFSHYKLPTIKRRIIHKMKQYGIETIPEYATLLAKKNNEVEILYTDLLINVTSFFREKDTFKYLKINILSKILKSKNDDESLRIWVSACSTGQEAYSIAMIIAEIQQETATKIPVQIFATDLSEKAITAARAANYYESEVKTIPKKYLSRYFTKTDDTYQIVKEIREMCVFAPHNILHDPPFSRMDFVSCCNLLIYFDAAAQKKVFSSLHFALHNGGYLMLGKSESIGTSSPLFTLISDNFKIYSRKNNLAVKKIPELLPRFNRSNLTNKKTNPTSKIINVSQENIENAIDSTLLASYMPACAVVNKDMEILQFRGDVASYLEHSTGKASLNILKMARPEFAFELRNAITTVFETKQKVIKTGFEIKVQSVLRLLSFEVSLLEIQWDEPLLLVVFKPQEEFDNFNNANLNRKSSNTLKDLKIKKLTDELSNVRAEMISIFETQENLYQELQAANEEIVSSNEEFQTLNEELETSKEEIEATNEELICTNQELQKRHGLLIESYEYSEAIIATIHEPMLVLNKNFKVISANKSFYKKFQVNKEQTEGKILFDLGEKQWNIKKLREVLHEIFFENTSFENFEVTQTFSGIGEKIMLLNAHLIIQKSSSEQLILLAIEDITDRSHYYIKEKFSLSLIEASLDPLTTVNNEGQITDMNNAMINSTGQTRQKLKGSNYFSYFSEPKKAFGAYQEVLANGLVTNAPLQLRHINGKLTDVLLNGSVYKDDKGTVQGLVFVTRDITDQKRFETELIEAKTIAETATQIAEEAAVTAQSATIAKQQFLSNMSHEIRTPMNAIIGFTAVLLRTALSEKQIEFLNAIKVSGDTLIALINDILDLAKVDAGKMIFEKKPFKITEAIALMLKLFQTRIEEKNLKLLTHFDRNIPEILSGDLVRLQQIILNLVSNSIKFTTEGKITVSTDLVFEDEDKVIIEFIITDTGIGIPKENIDLIFENFQQANNQTAGIHGGTGLGLAIVKQLVTAQEGNIRVKSKIDIGTTFRFTLPFQKTTVIDQKVINAEELQCALNNVKVLIVEDVIINQLLMKTILSDFKLEYDIASNGQIAIEMLEKSTYDIILMDLQMPTMNGYDATKYIRETMKITTPIIALTADVTTVDLGKCQSLGMNDYIAKPLDTQLLLNKIREFTN
jgi:two-component system CheB/CheR fusion protein